MSYNQPGKQEVRANSYVHQALYWFQTWRTSMATVFQRLKQQNQSESESYVFCWRVWLIWLLILSLFCTGEQRIGNYQTNSSEMVGTWDVAQHSLYQSDLWIIKVVFGTWFIVLEQFNTAKMYYFLLYAWYRSSLWLL